MNIVEATRLLIARIDEDPQQYFVIYSPTIKKAIWLSHTPGHRDFCLEWQGNYRYEGVRFKAAQILLEDYEVGSIDELISRGVLK